MTDATKKTDLTPTELAKLIQTDLMTKPNKGVVVKSFINNVTENASFMYHCLKNIELDSIFFEDVIQICNKKIEDKREDEIKKIEAEILERQEKLKRLKK
jgi:hypothetical protein